MISCQPFVFVPIGSCLHPSRRAGVRGFQLRCRLLQARKQIRLIRPVLVAAPFLVGSSTVIAPRAPPSAATRSDLPGGSGDGWSKGGMGRRAAVIRVSQAICHAYDRRSFRKNAAQPAGIHHDTARSLPNTLPHAALRSLHSCDRHHCIPGTRRYQFRGSDRPAADRDASAVLRRSEYHPSRRCLIIDP